MVNAVHGRCAAVEKGQLPRTRRSLSLLEHALPPAQYGSKPHSKPVYHSQCTSTCASTRSAALRTLGEACVPYTPFAPFAPYAPICPLRPLRSLRPLHAHAPRRVLALGRVAVLGVPRRLLAVPSRDTPHASASAAGRGLGRASASASVLHIPRATPRDIRRAATGAGGARAVACGRAIGRRGRSLRGGPAAASSVLGRRAGGGGAHRRRRAAAALELGGAARIDRMPRWLVEPSRLRGGEAWPHLGECGEGLSEALPEAKGQHA